MQKIYGVHTVLSLLQTKPELIEKIFLQEGRQDPLFLTVQSLANSASIPLQIIARSHLDTLVSEEVLHQGIVAFVPSLPTYSERDLGQFLEIENVLLLVLDGVQDPHNLGACLRSANAFGVHAVIAPKDRAVSVTPTVRKVACGAAEITPFIAVTNLSRVLQQLKERGVWLIGTDDKASAAISDIDLKGSIGLVMGAEGRGLRRLTKENCDYLAKIPMRGDVSSFNVSVATGICLYEINRQQFLVGK